MFGLDIILLLFIGVLTCGRHVHASVDFWTQPCGEPTGLKQKSASPRQESEIVTSIILKLSENERRANLSKIDFVSERLHNFSEEYLNSLKENSFQGHPGMPASLTDTEIFQIVNGSTVEVHKKAYEMLSRMAVFLDKARADELQHFGQGIVLKNYVALVGNLTSILCNVHTVITKNHNSTIDFVDSSILEETGLSSNTEAKRRERDFIILYLTFTVNQNVQQLFEQLERS